MFLGTVLLNFLLPCDPGSGSQNLAEDVGDLHRAEVQEDQADGRVDEDGRREPRDPQIRPRRNLLKLRMRLLVSRSWSCSNWSNEKKKHSVELADHSCDLKHEAEELFLFFNPKNSNLIYLRRCI